jgi:hypothetical protein
VEDDGESLTFFAEWLVEHDLTPPKGVPKKFEMTLEDILEGDEDDERCEDDEGVDDSEERLEA